MNSEYSYNAATSSFHLVVPLLAVFLWWKWPTAYSYFWIFFKFNMLLWKMTSNLSLYPPPSVSTLHFSLASIYLGHQPIYFPDRFFDYYLFCLFPSDCSYFFVCLFVVVVVVVALLVLFLCFLLFVCFLFLFLCYVSFIVRLVKLLVRRTFPLPPSHLPHQTVWFIAYKQKACWWAHDVSLYDYFVVNEFLFKSLMHAHKHRHTHTPVSYTHLTLPTRRWV